jgi:hypothetical protein
VVVDHPGRGDTSSYSTANTSYVNTSLLSDGADKLFTFPYTTSRPYYNTPRYTNTSESRSITTSSSSGPGTYSYSSEQTTRSSDRPGSYSHSSVTTGRLPHGSSYRHYSYR